jgi:hypothetical protein
MVHSGESSFQLATSIARKNRMPRQVVDNLHNSGPFTVVRVVRRAEGTRSASTGLMQPSPNRTTGVIWFLVLDMHLLIRAITTNRLGPLVAERTDPPDEHS